MESMPEGGSGLSIEASRAGLGFGGRREDVAHDASKDMEVRPLSLSGWVLRKKKPEAGERALASER